METLVNSNAMKVNLPDMNAYVYIREQNGEDDDILSNPIKSETLSNFSEFISRIVVDTNLTPNRKLTEQQAHELPCNIRYAILIASRIFSLGQVMEFEYTWPNGDKIRYEQDLKELLFDDYHQSPTEEELNAKPFAVPYYPFGNTKNFTIMLQSGKEVSYSLLTGKGEAMMMNTPVKTKNLELKARDLKLKVGDKWETVQSFALFSPRDMAEIRKSVAENDPYYTGLIELEHPTKGYKAGFSIMGTPDFFYIAGY